MAASTSRSLGGAEVVSCASNSEEAAVTASTARSKASSLAREGLLDPLIFRTYWSAAFRTSSSVAGGSKLWSVLIFRHMNESLGDRIVRGSAELCPSMPSSVKRCLLAAVVPALLLPAGALAATKPENGAVAFSAKRAGSRVIYTRERDGTGLRLIDTAGLADHPAVSPRGRRVAFTKYGPWGAQVWVTYRDGTGLRRLTAGSTDTMPAWNSSGRDVVFASGAKGRRDLYRVVADGTGLRRLTLSRRNDEAPAWSATDRIAFVRRTAKGDDIYTMSASGGSARRLTRNRREDRDPAWSPTARTVVFARGRPGKRDLYVIDSAGGRARRLTAVPGDETDPVFSPDGTRVAFIHRRRGRQHLYLLKVKGKSVRRLPSRGFRVRRLTTGRSAARAPSWAPSGLDPVIAAAGDIACDPTNAFFNNGVGQPRYCRQKLSSDLLLRSDLSRVLVVGDAQYETGTLAQFQQSFHPSWGRVKPLISPVPGNHEYYTPGAPGYYDYFNGPGAATGPAGDRDKGYYSYEIGGWHVVALNSQCEEIGGCDPDSPQARWFRADLATHPAACTLAYWHGPRYTSGRYGNQSEDVRPLFDAAYAGGVDVVLSGHEHFYERFAPQDGAGRADAARGVRQFTVGVGGRGPHGFATVAPNSEFRTSSVIGVLEMTLGEGTFDWRLVRARSSSIADSGSGRCH